MKGVGLKVNLWCDKACNHICAPFPFYVRTFTLQSQRSTFQGRTISSRTPPGGVREVNAEGQCSGLCFIQVCVFVCVLDGINENLVAGCVGSVFAGGGGD